MPLAPRCFPLALTLICGLGFAACATRPAHLENLVVVSEGESNHGEATAVDLVFVFDSSLLPRMPRNSLDWFAQRSALVVAAGSALEVVTMQVPPASMAHVPLPAKGSKAVAVLVYAAYSGGSGQAVGDISGHKEVEIRLAKDAVIYGGK